MKKKEERVRNRKSGDRTSGSKTEKKIKRRANLTLADYGAQELSQTINY